MYIEQALLHHPAFAPKCQLIVGHPCFKAAFELALDPVIKLVFMLKILGIMFISPEHFIAVDQCLFGVQLLLEVGRINFKTLHPHIATISRPYASVGFFRITQQVINIGRHPESSLWSHKGSVNACV